MRIFFVNRHRRKIFVITIVMVFIFGTMMREQIKYQLQKKSLSFSDILPDQWDWRRDLDCQKRLFDDDEGDLNVCGVPVLTMFTSIHQADTSRELIHNNTINNWSSLGSCVQRVLYLNETDSDLAIFARNNSWSVENVPRTLKEIPILKWMYLRTFQLRDTPLYLYANADILFDLTLVKTVRSLLCTQRALSNNLRSIEQQDSLNRTQRSDHASEGIFAVGRRVNFNVTNETSVSFENIAAIHRENTPFYENAEDYFLTTSQRGLRLQSAVKSSSFTEDLFNENDYFSEKDVAVEYENITSDLLTSMNYTQTGHFPWRNVLDFVIGRPGYDNWLVTKAIAWNITWSIDLSLTVHALHQSGLDGDLSGWSSPAHQTTLLVNRDMAGEEYDYSMGKTLCLPWLSTVTMEGQLAFVPRRKIDDVCFKEVKVVKERPKRKVNIVKEQPKWVAKVIKERPKKEMNEVEEQPKKELNVFKDQPKNQLNVLKQQPTTQMNVIKEKPKEKSVVEKPVKLKSWAVTVRTVE